MSAEVPIDEEEFARWREESDRALRGARLQAKESLANWACFTAEQAAQLAVKALLHGLGRGPWGHDLGRLGEMVAEAGIEVSGEVADTLLRLSRHYIPARYPDVHPSGSAGEHYSDADADAAIADAEEIIGFVDRAWEEARGA